MKNNRFILIVSFLVVSAFFVGCNDSWDDHASVNKDVKTISVMKYLETQPDFSKFTDLVKETGLDQQLSSPILYSLFVPSNEAMGNVPQELLATSEDKLLFVKHHIIEGRFLLSEIKNDRELKMLNGKVLELEIESTQIDDISIKKSEVVALNGVIYTLEDAIIPRLSVWEYIENRAPRNKQVNFINSLTKLQFDEELSEEIGFNADGQPIYDSIFVYKNDFNKKVTNLASEDSTFTLILIEDDAFDAEFVKFNRYFRAFTDKNKPANGRDSINIQLEIVRDYVFTQSYALEEIPSQLVSPAGVKVNFNEGAVISSFRASNGYVYLLQSCPVELSAKIPEVKVEAEQLKRYFGIGKDEGAAQGYLRINPKASGGKDFVLDNHTTRAIVNGLVLSGGKLPSIRYKVYWRAVNNFRTSMRNPNDNILMQRLGTVKPTERDIEGNITKFGAPITGSINTSFFPVELTEYSDVPADDETYIGIFNNLTFEEVFFQLIPEGASTKAMAVTLDYIRLVPEFN